jgi:hypothetical protein
MLCRVDQSDNNAGAPPQCPDRLDLMHKHFRKFCTVVVDMDEWGQIACINLLTRYARTQFTDPDLGVCLWFCRSMRGLCHLLQATSRSESPCALKALAVALLPRQQQIIGDARFFDNRRPFAMLPVPSEKKFL